MARAAALKHAQDVVNEIQTTVEKTIAAQAVNEAASPGGNMNIRRSIDGATNIKTDLLGRVEQAVTNSIEAGLTQKVAKTATTAPEAKAPVAPVADASAAETPKPAR